MDLMEFCLWIGLEPGAAQACCAYQLTPEELLWAYEALRQDEAAFLAAVNEKPDAALCYLALYTRLAHGLWAEYEARGIARTVYQATFADLARWEREYHAATGRHGLGETEWLAHHLRLELFQLGSLQFEPLAQPPVPLPAQAQGLPVLNLHIPKGADLSARAIEQACRRALHFWGWKRAVFMCHSWLLSPALKQLLAPGSRILEFGARFELLALDEACRQAEERIFGRVQDVPAAYPSGTRLQAAAKQLLLGGGAIPSAYGWFVADRGRDV